MELKSLAKYIATFLSSIGDDEQLSLSTMVDEENYCESSQDALAFCGLDKDSYIDSLLFPSQDLRLAMEKQLLGQRVADIDTLEGMIRGLRPQFEIRLASGKSYHVLMDKDKTARFISRLYLNRAVSAEYREKALKLDGGYDFLVALRRFPPGDSVLGRIVTLAFMDVLSPDCEDFERDMALASDLSNEAGGYDDVFKFLAAKRLYCLKWMGLEKEQRARLEKANFETMRLRGEILLHADKKLLANILRLVSMAAEALGYDFELMAPAPEHVDMGSVDVDDTASEDENTPLCDLLRKL